MKQLIIIVCLIMNFNSLSYGADDSSQKGILKQDTINTYLTRHINQSVTLKLSSGEEISGKLTSIGQQLLYLSQLKGREYFSAAVLIKSIDGVITRTQ